MLGGDDESRLYRARRRWEVCNADGRCTYCHPHRGENETANGRRKDVRYVDIGEPPMRARLPRKPKEKK